MIPQNTDLHYFLVLAETLNVTRASEKLVMAQSTISQSLKRLEEGLGTELFIRRKNGLELTRAGIVFHQKVQNLMIDWQNLAQDTREVQNTPKGLFSIGVHASAALYTLPEALPQLLNEYPQLDVHLQHESSASILEGVISGRIDFGLIINPIKHPDLVMKKICQDRYTFWKSKNCLNHDVLLLNKNVTANEVILNKKKIAYARQVHSMSFEVIAELTRKGTGVGLLPERVARLYDLHQIHKDSFVEDTLYFCYRKERQKSMGGRVIIDVMTLLQKKLS